MGGELAAAGLQQETKGSTALKALATHKSSHCIVQSANLLHQLRKSSSHPEQVSGSLSLSLSLSLSVHASFLSAMLVSKLGVSRAE